MYPAIGNWYRVKDGAHKGKIGVCDLIEAFNVGTRYRLTNRDGVVGRFAAEQIEPTRNPQAAYESQVPDAARQRAMDLLTKGLPS